MSLALIRSSPAVDLNPEQQLAVEHGIGDPGGSGPLLVIAGAGSGKTAMLAHRVAALILAGADPKRIMLATFSRRAAAELGRRVERLLARRLAPEAAAAATPAYAGTFHAIGARLLREYATRLGLDPQFTIHDREDSADLMNWARHEMGVGDLKERFPTKATCLTIYSRVVNAQGELKATLGKWFPWVAAHEDALRALFASYVETKQRQNVLDYDDLLLYFAQMLSEPAIAAEIAGALRSSAGRRIPGHQCAAGRDRAAPKASGTRPDRGRRRRAGDLFLPRGDGAQHPRFSSLVRSARACGDARAQLSFERRRACRRQRSHRARARALRQDASHRSAAWGPSPVGRGRRRCRPGPLCGDPRPRQSRDGRCA